jgi:hypothetical protein
MLNFMRTSQWLLLQNIISSSTMAPFHCEYIKIEYFDSVGFEAFTIYLKYKRLIIDK